MYHILPQRRRDGARRWDLIENNRKPHTLHNAHNIIINYNTRLDVNRGKGGLFPLYTFACTFVKIISCDCMVGVYMVRFWYHSVYTFLFLTTRLTTDTVLLDVQDCTLIAQEYNMRQPICY